MTTKPTYPRRARVHGGRSTHAIPAKGHNRIEWGYRHIVAPAACGTEVDLTPGYPGRGRVLDDDVEVTCTKCARALLNHPEEARTDG